MSTQQIDFGFSEKELEEINQAIEQHNREVRARERYWQLATDVGTQYHAEVKKLGEVINAWHEAMDRAEVTTPGSLVGEHHEQLAQQLKSIGKLISLWFSELMGPKALDALEPYSRPAWRKES